MTPFPLELKANELQICRQVKEMSSQMCLLSNISLLLASGFIVEYVRKCELSSLKPIF